MNNAIPDHEPSKNDVYLPEKRSPEHHPMVQFLLGGFGNWDSEYFIMIAEHGYLYEQSLAFFPLLPWVMNVTSSIVYSSTGLSQATIPARSMNLIMGWAVSNLAFLFAALLLYQLTLKVYGSRKMAAVTSLLFAISPASVFMSSVYTESMFAMFSFAGMLCLEMHHPWAAILLFTFGGATRSNGILALLFLALYHYMRLVASGRSYLARGVIIGAVQSAFIIAPYTLFQLYGYCIYCSTSEGGSLVDSLIASFCSSAPLPAMVHQPTTHPPWCDQTLPHPYGYVQATYWNVGFLKYYQLKQIPNFLLATPMALIGGLSLWRYFSSCGQRLPSLLLGRRPEHSKQEDERLAIPAPIGVLVFLTAILPYCISHRCLRLLPYVLHLAFLTAFGVTSMHIQVEQLLVYMYCVHLRMEHMYPWQLRSIGLSSYNLNFLPLISPLPIRC